MVMPHSALQAGQHAKWRTGEWKSRGGARTLHVNFQVRKAWDLERLNPNTFFPIPSSVVFAKRIGEEGKARPLAGTVRQWIGATGSTNVRWVDMETTDSSKEFLSPYAKLTRKGADIYPRVLFFVNEIPNPATVRVGGTVTTQPRRGVYDKQPWKSLSLTNLYRNTVEEEHLFDVHLGETVLPYGTLNPLKALLPMKRNAVSFASDAASNLGVPIGSLDRRMQQRWSQINGIWDQHKSPTNRLSLLEQLDFYGKLSSQIIWRNDNGGRPIRVAYSASGIPTATIVANDDFIVDYTLLWLTCQTLDEAHYLTAVINSNHLYEQLKPLMPKGQFGARHVLKHVWRLPIPEFDDADSTHVAVSDAGRRAALGVERELGNLRQRYARLTVTIARREIRKWLRESVEGKRVEEVVGVLLGG